MRLALLVTAAVLLAGCTGDSQEFSEQPGSIAPGRETFVLTVRLVSIEDLATPIVGATVTAGGATGATISNVTGADGTTTLLLAAPQVVALEATADGHVPAATAGVRLGNASADDVSRDIGSGLACAFSFGLACPRDVTTRLAGTSGRVTIRMIPRELVREVEIPIEAAANPPTQDTRVAAELVLSSDAASADLLGRSLARADATLAWTNAPGAAADFDVGIACTSIGTIAESQSGGAQTLATMGERSVSAAAAIPPECGTLVAEVILRSVNTAMTPVATAKLTFAPQVQQPMAG